MELLGVRVERPLNSPVILLRERAGQRRVLPIYIGHEEARAIALALEGVQTPRPMTHDLMRDLLQALDVAVMAVTVTELRDNEAGSATFYAEITLGAAGRSVQVSSRPSDAVALAVRVDAPLYAAEDVLDAAAAPLLGEDDEAGEEVPEEIVDQFREFLDDVNPEDFAS